MELDDGGAKRIRRLRELRDEVVALLRDVPSAGPLPMELRKRAFALRRLLAPAHRERGRSGLVVSEQRQGHAV